MKIKNAQAGFTLIELLVVIAIIGILATIVLTSLGSARTKAQDAKIQAQLSGMRAQAQLYSSTVASAFALGACATTADTLFSNVAGENNLGSMFPSSTFTNTACVSGAGLPSTANAHWAVAWPTSTGWFCSDYTGSARAATTAGVAYTGASGASPAAITVDSCN